MLTWDRERERKRDDYDQTGRERERCGGVGFGWAVLRNTDWTFQIRICGEFAVLRCTFLRNSASEGEKENWDADWRCSGGGSGGMLLLRGLQKCSFSLSFLFLLFLSFYTHTRIFLVLLSCMLLFNFCFQGSFTSVCMCFLHANQCKILPVIFMFFVSCVKTDLLPSILACLYGWRCTGVESRDPGDRERKSQKERDRECAELSWARLLKIFDWVGGGGQQRRRWPEAVFARAERWD